MAPFLGPAYELPPTALSLLPRKSLLVGLPIPPHVDAVSNSLQYESK